MIKAWFKSGNPWIWFTASAVSACLIMVLGVLGLIMARGIGHFWPGDLVQFSYQEDNGQVRDIVGERIDTTITPAAMAKATGFIMADNEDVLVQYQIKTGNRDVTGADFRWILERRIKQQSNPPELIAVERREWGNFYGRLVAVKEGGKMIAEGAEAMPVLQERLKAALGIFEKISHLEKKEIGAINYGLERLRLEQRKLELEKRWDTEAKQRLAAEKAVLDGKYKKLQTQLMALYQDIRKDSFVAAADDGSEHEIALAKVVRVYEPNKMSVFGKIGHYFTKFAEFLTDDPREANTEGGIFPAIYGTVLMVVIMSIIVTPFGVIAAVYLREYAKQGFMTRLIRIAVNNLAGVPSMVYGVFGLGFFVYILGGKIDRLFYPEASARADVRYAGADVGVAHAGAADAAGRDRVDRRRAGADSEIDPRRQPGARRNQVRNARGVRCCRWPVRR